MWHTTLCHHTAHLNRCQAPCGRRMDRLTARSRTTTMQMVCGIPETDLGLSTLRKRVMTNEFTDTANEELFRVLPRETTLANRVSKQLEELIVERRLQPGDRLPAERELARQFGVSRTVIREAVRSLAAKAMIEVKS